MEKCKTNWCNNNWYKYYWFCQKCLSLKKDWKIIKNKKWEWEWTENKKVEIIKENFSTQIENLQDLRKNYPANIRTEDWHYVRSKAEQAVDNWLYNRGIPHAYEKRVPIEEFVYSDFFIPIWKKVYIEFWGLENDEKYKKRKELKIQYYKENNKNLIELTDKDIENLDDVMPVKLRPYLPESFSFD